MTGKRKNRTCSSGVAEGAIAAEPVHMDMKTFGKIMLIIFIVLLFEGLFMNMFAGEEIRISDRFMAHYFFIVSCIMPVISAAGIVTSAGLIMARPWARWGMIAILGCGIICIAAMGTVIFLAILAAAPDMFAPGAGRGEGLVYCVFIGGLFIFLISLAIRHLLKAGR